MPPEGHTHPGRWTLQPRAVQFANIWMPGDGLASGADAGGLPRLAAPAAESEPIRISARR